MTREACPPGESLKGFVDGELGKVAAEAIRRHLGGCAACAAEADAMRRIGTELKQLEGAVEPPPDLRQRILARIHFEPEGLRRSSPFDWLRWASAAAIAVVAAAILIPNFNSAREMARAPAGAAGSDWADSRQMAKAVRVYRPDEDEAAVMAQRGRDMAPGGAPALTPSAPAASAPAPAAPAASAAAEPPGAGMAGHPADFAARSDSEHRIGGTYGNTEAAKSPLFMDGNSKVMAGRPPATAPMGGQQGRLSPDEIRRYARGEQGDEVRRKVVQSAELSVRARERLEGLQDKIAARVKQDGGYVENTSLNAPQGADAERISTMSLRVPEAKFEPTIAWLSSLGEVASKNMGGTDVTATWVEQRDRLRRLRAEEERLLKAYDRAEKKAEKERLRWELLGLKPQIGEQEQAFAKTTKLAALAAIRLTLIESPQARVRGNLMGDLENTTRAAVASFLLAVRVPLSILIWTVIYAPLWVPAALLYRWATRRARA